MNDFISVIIPTYNERHNITPLVEQIHAVLSNESYEILLVDDDSKDGTVELASALSAKYPVQVIVRKNERGLASAVVYGFGHARGDILAVMDADLQHPPQLLKDMLKIARNGADVVIGSRYVSGGSCEGWKLTRRIISKGAIFLAHLLLPRTRQISDPMSGYFLLRKSVLSGAELQPTGYKILLEVLMGGHYNQVTEVPYCFHIRERGESKLNIRQQIDYLKHLLSLMRRTGEITRFFKFCLVGASGVLVNEGLLWILIRFASLPLAVASGISIETSILSNFILNDFLTFHDRRPAGARFFIQRLVKFNAVSLVGLGINMGLLLLLTNVFNLYYLISNLIGIAVAMLWNYLVNLGYTWR
jgi:dolichol-phosphate mannosyltransferase